jgi:hypothetical protein
LNTPIYTLKEELREDLTYYWTVIPHDEEFTGRCLSDAWNFSIQPDIPDIPYVTLTAPEDGSTLSKKSPALRWKTNFTGSDHFTSFIIVYPDPDYHQQVGFTTPLVYSEYQYSGYWAEEVYKVIPDTILEDNHRYKWTVIPSAGGIVGQCTNGPWNFEINTSYKEIYNVTLLAPTDLPVYPGSNSSTYVTVKNTGNVNDIYEVGIASDDFEGNVELEYDGGNFQLQPGGSRRLTLNLTVPSTILPGEYPVKVAATSLGSGGSVSTSATITIKVLGDEPQITPEEKEEGLESWLLALIIVVVIAIIVVVVLFVFISKKRKSKEEAAVKPDEAAAELSYIPKDAFGSERDAIATYSGGQVDGATQATGLPTVAAGEGAAGVVTPTEALPPQAPYEQQPAGFEQPDMPASPYEGAVTESPAEPPTPDGWQAAPQLPPGVAEQTEGEEEVRYDSIEGPAPEAPPPAEEDQSQIQEQKQIDYPEPQEQAQYYQAQPQQQYQQEQYPQQQVQQQYIPCPYCGGQNVYGQQNCSYCGNLLSYY